MLVCFNYCKQVKITHFLFSFWLDTWSHATKTVLDGKCSIFPYVRIDVRAKFGEFSTTLRGWNWGLKTQSDLNWPLAGSVPNNEDADASNALKGDLLISSPLLLISSSSKAFAHDPTHWRFCSCVSVKQFPCISLTPPRPRPCNTSCHAPSMWLVNLFVAAQSHFLSFTVWELRVDDKLYEAIKTSTIEKVSSFSCSSLAAKLAVWAELWLHGGLMVPECPCTIFYFFVLTVVCLFLTTHFSRRIVFVQCCWLVSKHCLSRENMWSSETIAGVSELYVMWQEHLHNLSPMQEKLNSTSNINMLAVLKSL